MIKVEQIVNRPLLQNTYIAYEEESRQGVIIDPGGSYIDVMGVLQKHKIKPTLILYTHLHLDHIAGGYDTAVQLSLPAYAGEKDLFLFESLEQTCDFLGYPPVTPPVIDGYITPEDEFEIGDTVVTTIPTPGHTPGGFSFVVSNHVFTGDVLFKESIGRTDLPGGDLSEIELTIRNKLYTLPEDYIVYPGHGETSTIGHEKKHNPYVRA